MSHIILFKYSTTENTKGRKIQSRKIVGKDLTRRNMTG